MKKDSRKVMALMLLAAMTASMTAGCSGKSSETTSTTAAGTEAAGTEAAGTEAAGTEAATESGLEGSLISAEPKEFTIFDNFNNMPFDSNWQVWQEVQKRTNIGLKGTIALTNSNEDEAFNLMLSSGQLADIISY